MHCIVCIKAISTKLELSKQQRSPPPPHPLLPRACLFTLRSQIFSFWVFTSAEIKKYFFQFRREKTGEIHSAKYELNFPYRRRVDSRKVASWVEKTWIVCPAAKASYWFPFKARQNFFFFELSIWFLWEKVSGSFFNWSWTVVCHSLNGHSSPAKS